MVVKAISSKTTVLVEMSFDELIRIAGFDSHHTFDKAFGTSMHQKYNYPFSSAESLIGVGNIDVGNIFTEAKETISAYEELRTKFESIRNQLSTLMKRMVALRPENKQEKE